MKSFNSSTQKVLGIAAVAGLIYVTGAFNSLMAAFQTNIAIDEGCVGTGYGYGYNATEGYGFGYSGQDCDTGTGSTATGVDLSLFPGVPGVRTCSTTGSQYDTEMNGAYKFACESDMTTIQHINDAYPHGALIRRDAAKIISHFAIKHLGKTPDLTKTCMFDDDNLLDTEGKAYVKLACQLGAMGYKGDGSSYLDNFNPNGVLTRAEFGTLLSRLLYGDANNSDANATNWYEGHLNALKADGIIKVTTPDLTESRGYVWIMLERAADME